MVSGTPNICHSFLNRLLRFSARRFRSASFRRFWRSSYDSSAAMAYLSDGPPTAASEALTASAAPFNPEVLFWVGALNCLPLCGELVSSLVSSFDFFLDFFLLSRR